MPMTDANEIEGFQGFLLSSSLTDLPGSGRRSTGLVYQGRLRDGRRFRWEVTRPRLCFFVARATADPPAPHARKPLELRTLRGHGVDALYFESAPDLARARRHYQGAGIPTYEADISATARHLMERGIQGSVRFLDAPVTETGGTLRFVDPKVASSEWTPSLRLLSLDVECAPGEGLFSLSLYGESDGAPWTRVFLRDPARPAGSQADGYISLPDEAAVLKAFHAAVREFDPDALVGWNLINFDLRYLARRCERAGLSLDLGTDGPAELIEPESASQGRNWGPQWLARIPGRCALDGIAMLRAAFVEAEEGYSLAAISRQVLGEKKLIELEGEEKLAEISRRFREDKPALARYNLEDSRLAHAIFAKLHLAALAVRKAQLTGLAVDRMGGSMAAFDFLYLPRLHRKGFVADTGSAQTGEAVPGGLVLEGVPGFFRNVLVLDFKSLYPSIIRTFMVDPLAAAAAELGLEAGGTRASVGEAAGAGREATGETGAPAAEASGASGPSKEAGPSGVAPARTLVRGPAGPAFAADMAILPGIVASLAEARERAKREKDASLSQAVKIIMNSFYGVLGNPTCRFHRPDLAGAITLSGQWILLASKEFLEKSGHRVIYGDTDSLFVHAGEEADPAGLARLGADLANRLNRHLEETLREKYGVESRLTMQSDKVFTRFFLPSLRREERGSKKRYAGLLAAAPGAEPVLHFAGMESARSDWTRLAKDFQADLLRTVFAAPGGPGARGAAGEATGLAATGVAGSLPAVDAVVRDWNRRLFAGELDQALEYRKGLSKAPEEYGASAPPHVRAARALDRRDGRTIRYVMTVEGPEPVQKRSGARPDYRHYADKQLAPIADMVLRFLGTDFASLTDEASQMSML